MRTIITILLIFFTISAYSQSGRESKDKTNNNSNSNSNTNVLSNTEITKKLQNILNGKVAPTTKNKVTETPNNSKDKSNDKSNLNNITPAVVDVNNLSTNPKKFNKNLSAKKFISLTTSPFGLWINEDIVDYSGSGNSYNLDVNSCNMYFMFNGSPTNDQDMIDERIDALKNVYKNFKIDTLEYRVVNGQKVIFLHCQGDYGTSHQVITGYYKAFSNGNVRVYAVVVDSYYKQNKKQIHDVLNGLICSKDNTNLNNLVDNTSKGKINTDNINVGSLSINPKRFNKTSLANKMIEIKGRDFGLWINPNIVTYTGSGDNYNLTVNSCYMYFSFESSPTNDQEVIANRVKTLKGVYTNYTIDTLEYRYVNGEKVVFLHSQGDYGTSHQVITGYYKAYPTGNIRVYAVVTEDYYKKNRKQIQDVLNGLVYLK